VTRLAVVSDTHGLVRPELLHALEGVERILHLGDVGGEHVIADLESVAPVTAVRGNCDPPGAFPESALVEWGGANFYLLHILEDLDLDPVAAGIDFVLFGHSHRPEQFDRGGVRFLNPGSVGPRRFQLPISFCCVDAKLRVRFEMLTA